MLDPSKTQTILFVGIGESDGLSLDKIFLESGWRSHGASNCQQALEFLDQHDVPVVLAESEMSDGNWRRLLKDMASLSVPPKLIVSSRLADHRLWAEVLNLGGYDVLMTPFEPEEVLRVTFAARHHWGSKQVDGCARAAGAGSPESQ